MDRYTEIEIALQRMADGARARSDDILYAQRREADEHINLIDHTLAMVEKVRGVLLEERRRFAPEKENPQAISQGRINPVNMSAGLAKQDKIPPFLAKGPEAPTER